MPFDELPPQAPPHDVARVTRDGLPTVAWMDYEERLRAWLNRFSARFRSHASDFTPTTATIAAAGAINRVVATMATPGATSPVGYAISANPGQMSIAFTGADLKTTANPCGAVGTHYVEITAIGNDGVTYHGTLQVILT